MSEVPRYTVTGAENRPGGESGGDDGKWNILNSGQTENYNPEFSDSIAKFAALHTNQPIL